jgi:uncharacterized membrane protein YhhN
MNLFKQYGFVIFWILAIADLSLIISEVEHYRYFTKPLLMPLLLLTIFSSISNHKHQTSKRIIAIAFLLATIGDVLLLNANLPSYFVGGLLAFLLMLLLFSAYFIRIKKFDAKHTRTIITCLLLFGCACSTFIYLMWGNLGEYRIPVVLYAVVLSFMCITAINVVHFSVAKSLALDAFIPGAILFFLSDFILAANMFYVKEAFLGIAVMATYCGAQYYLARGFVKHLR